jgi:DNA mismatch repair protein MutL
MKINLLSDDVINKIAAGEVVERPVSVVRELVDNALDAEAGEISVALVSGGQTSIRVLDDGQGMEEDDAKLCFARHATSKLRCADDLLGVKTLGFRGEALSSIAAVSKVSIRTRTQNGAFAACLSLEAGRVLESSRASGPVGTEVEVKHLFFNTPARRKFLKSVRAEEIKVKQLLTHMALGFPAVRFKLSLEDRQVLNLSPRGSAAERAQDIFRGSGVRFNKEVGPAAIEGWVAHPSQAASQAGSFVVMVNRRVIVDRMLLKAVKDGFGAALKGGEYPL